MPYKLIRIDPINPTFELKFIDNDQGVSADVASGRLITYSQDVIYSKFDFKLKEAILIDDRKWKPGEKKTIVTCQEESSRFKEKIKVKYRIFSGSYKPFWIEYLEGGMMTVETNLIPDTKSFLNFKKKYDQYLDDYNDQWNIRELKRRTLWFGQFGGFYEVDNLIYNKDNRLIYEI